MNTPENDSTPAASDGRGGLAPIDLWYVNRAAADGRIEADRTAAQIDAIEASFKKAGVPLGVHRDPKVPDRFGRGGTADFLYHPERILTRDADAARVYQVLGITDAVDKSDRRTPTQPIGLHVIPLPADMDAVAAVEQVDQILGVGVAVPDHLLHVTATTWCAAIEPEPATTTAVRTFAPNTAGHGVRVSIVDTGLIDEVVADHPGWLDDVTGDPEPASVGHYTGHGSFIAGVVRAHAPGAEVRVESAMRIGGASFEADLFQQLVQALDWAPDVISLSGGTRTMNNLPPLSFQVFWEHRLKQHRSTVLVAAAGNDGDRGPFWPAAFPWCVAVGALDQKLTARAGFSNFGGWVDVYAPGERIVSTYPRGTYTYQEPPRVPGSTADFPDGLAYWSGTSFAAPMVAGAIAARMTWSGENGRTAADSLLALARQQTIPGVGPVLTA